MATPAPLTAAANCPAKLEHVNRSGGVQSSPVAASSSAAELKSLTRPIHICLARVGRSVDRAMGVDVVSGRIETHFEVGQLSNEKTTFDRPFDADRDVDFPL
jgi:hypothetical protein